MREVEIRKYCDSCWLDGEQRTPSVGAWTVGVVAGDGATGRPAVKVLDLCEPHAKVIVDLIAILGQVETLPAKVEQAAPAAARTRATTEYGLRRVPCPVCRREVGRAALVAHVWAVHRDTARPPVPLICPDCRVEYGSGQGVSSHRRMEHGYDALDEALRGVKGYKVTGRESEEL